MHPPDGRFLSPLDFLAEFTQHITPKGSHLVIKTGPIMTRPSDTERILDRVPVIALREAPPWARELFQPRPSWTSSPSSLTRLNSFPY